MRADLAQRRRQRADDMDLLLRELYGAAMPAEDGHSGVALVAVGGFGRQELSPFSDLDVVLVHDPAVPAATADEIAHRIWYPLWDRNVDLDHSVRDSAQMIQAAADDYRTATGMLDARPVAGDGNVVLELRSEVLAAWRRSAKSRLTEVREARDQRIERAGWLAHAAIPDLKDSGGGLRDGVLMRALVATWLVDVPHAESEWLRGGLLDVRDALHEVVGKRGDRLTPESIPDVARVLGMAPEELDLHARHLGWRSAHLNALAWRKVGDLLAGSRTRSQKKAGPKLIEVARGVARLEGEIVLTAGADARMDPVLGLRAAASAAESHTALATASAIRIADTMTDLPEPWPPAATRLIVDLLAAGRGLVPVWDELDYAGVVERWLPEWNAIRLRGSSSPVHRFTVDRHLLETCVEASSRLRSVSRPDVLIVAALLHDIGKGLPGDHSEVGAPMAERIALRWGFGAVDAAQVGLLVRWHLLLPTVATRRDIEDPSTAANVAEIVKDADTLDLLVALTESDARATSPGAWSSWRSGLVLGLVDKVRDVLDSSVITPDPSVYEGWPEAASTTAGTALARDLPADDGFALSLESHHTGSLISVTIVDRVGAMAQIAAAIALAGLEVLSARAVTDGRFATTLWEVTRQDVDPERVAGRLRLVLAGEVDLATRLALDPSSDETEPRVRVLEGLSETATLLEVRAQDRRGLVWTVCQAIAEVGGLIRSAHLSTYGPEARDVFYVVDAGGGLLDPPAARRLTDQVASALR